MLEALRFVQGAIAKKDLVAALTHFRIQDGEVKGYNGMIALRSPIPLNLNVTPKALPFIKAIQTCRDTVSLHVTPKGKLAVASGGFKAFVECLPDAYPDVGPEGPRVELEPGLLAALKTLLPFVSEDASRPWSRGILLRGQSAFATNNVVLVEYWLPAPAPIVVNLPKAAVVELVRIGEDPVALQMTETNVTFHFTGGRWLRTQTFSSEWPDLAAILNRGPGEQLPILDGFWEAVEDLAPFVGPISALYLRNGSISTTRGEDEGASQDVPGLVAEGVFNIEYLRLLEDVAVTADFIHKGSPVSLFFGDRLRGAIAGLRHAE